MPYINDTDSESGTDLAYGIGASLLFTKNFGLRFEYDVINADDDLKSTNIGLEVRF